jgi:hypothetical protein
MKPFQKSSNKTPLPARERGSPSGFRPLDFHLSPPDCEEDQGAASPEAPRNRRSPLVSTDNPTKNHFFPLLPTIDKKKAKCKAFLVIFSLEVNELGRLLHKNFIL